MSGGGHRSVYFFIAFTPTVGFYPVGVERGREGGISFV